MEYNFLQAMYHCKQLYDVEFTDPDEFAEIGYNGWKLIGNRRTTINKIVADVDPVTLTIELPCGVDFIESVTVQPENWNESTNIHSNGDYSSNYTEQWIESTKSNTHPLYTSGRFIHYRRIGDKLYFERAYRCVTIVYRGVVLDEDDLPIINDKEMEAIAVYVAYVVTYKQALRTKNQATFNFSQDLKKQWLFKCDEARTPNDPLSQNEFDEILDAHSRIPSKRFGNSFKPLM